MKRYTLWLFYGLVFCLFYVLSHFTPVDFGDDTNYKLVFGEGRPIESITDVFVSVYNHYFVQHGRIPFVFFSQLFDGVLGKSLFDVVNSIVFCLTLFLLLYYAQQQRSFFATVLSLFLAFVFLPAFEETHLWLVGSTDYLWASTFIIVFFILLRKFGQDKNSVHLLWLCPYALIAAMYHEGFSLAISFGLLVYFYLFRKTAFQTTAFPVALAFMIGTALLAFAPGTLRRTHADNGIDLVYIGTRVVAGVYSLFLTLRIFWLTVLSLVLLYRKKRTKFDEFTNLHVVELSAMLISPMILFVAARYGGRINYTIEILSMMVLLQLLPLFDFKKFEKRMVLVMVAVMLLIYVPVTIYAHENYIHYKSVLSQLNQKQPVIRVQSLSDDNFLTSRYIHKMVRIGIDSYYQAFSPEDPVMRATAMVYGLPNVCFIPEEVASYIDKHGIAESLIIQNGWPVYVRCLAEGQNISKVKFMLGDVDFSKIPFYLRPIASKLAKYVLPEIEPRFSVVEYKNRRLLLVERQLPEVEARIRQVVLE